MEEKSSIKSKTSRKLLFGLTASLLLTGCNSNNKKVEPTDDNQKRVESSVDNSKSNSTEKHQYEIVKGDISSGFAVKQKKNTDPLENKKEISYKGGSRVLSIRNYHGYSIVDALEFIGYDSSFQSRSKLAKKYGIKNYKGTAKQNTKLLKKLKKDNFSNKKKSSAKVKKDKKTKKNTLISVIVSRPIEIINPIIEPTITPKPTRIPKPTIIPKPTRRPIETTKPKPTATATSAPTAGPTGTPAPVITAKPTGTPIGTKAPVETAKPAGTIVPPATVTPTGRPVPVVTARPTGAPVRTTAPVETARPTGTTIPTVIPTATATPAGTIVPPATVTPGVTAPPAPSPSPTAAISPSPTVEPTETPEPCQHGIYDKIDQTAGDDEYCYHLSYVCSKCGETISMDSEANKHSYVEYDDRPYDWYKECSKCFHTIDLPQETLAELILKSKMMVNPDYRINFTTKDPFVSCLEKNTTAKTYIKRR